MEVYAGKGKITLHDKNDFIAKGGQGSRFCWKNETA
jgi:hypothetical protein